MAQTMVVTGSVGIPFEDGGTPAPISLAVSVTFTSRADFSRAYAGAVANDPVDLGTLTVPGARGIIVKCNAGSCTVAFQSTSGQAWPLAPGGAFLWANPSAAFPTSAFVTVTGAASVTFIAVG